MRIKIFKVGQRFKSSLRRNDVQILAEKYLDNPLFDNFGRFHNYLRISVTERCNLRCLYCMPEEGVTLSPNSNILNKYEIFKLIKVFVGLGVDTVRFTGGEPLVRKDIIEIISDVDKLKSNGLRKILMTTNGIGLERKIKDLKSAGIDGFNVSLDTLDANKYALITRRSPAGLKKVWSAIEACVENKIETVKINCVVIRNLNDEELWKFVELTKELPVDIRFIEYMPFGGNKWELKKTVPFWEMLDMINEQRANQNISSGILEPIKFHDKHSTAKMYQVAGYKGRVGFITSNTLNFCGTCNRIRITADGGLKPCLHDNYEVNLREQLRQLDDTDNYKLITLIKEALSNKKREHDDVVKLSNKPNRPMILIGG